MNPLHIPPNTPLHVALVDPQGVYDFELRVGQYETTIGQLLTLPRPAVVLLNMLEPRPGEEIVITKHWSGTPGAVTEWTIGLSTRSEMARAANGEADTLTEQLEASLSAIPREESPVAPPVPIRKPVKPAAAPEVQPRLFDRGTGTTGPAPAQLPAAIHLPAMLPAVASRKTPPVQIPWNVAFREVSAWVSKELAANNLQWSDEAQQAMVCTCLIAEVKAGRITTWERQP